MKIAVVTCYKHNDYERARALRTAVAACPGAEAVIVRNRHKGLLRYPEIALKLWRVRWFERPDAYVITFRGYEILLLMALTFVRKPVIFDELVNFTEWMVEHGRLRTGSIPYRLFRRWNQWMVKRCRFILADTDAHAKQSAILNMLSINRYKVIPVCADETIFHPDAGADGSQRPFTVLYYGTMVALHGLDYVLQAALLLKDNPDIQFRLIVGKTGAARDCAKAAAAGARLSHEGWMPLEALPAAIHQAGVVLGGPFGNTPQSQSVITGKTYQALACAAPVLIGKNQVSEDFKDKQNCLVVSQANPRALAEAVVWAAAHPKELVRIGVAGRDLYETRFSQKIVNGLVQEIVETL
ncbi:MAG TPA: glycosyltransferase [Candidatus Saccharimonadales bacterium]|nr:glycosyltransferase [Candidatus Saccharimonadales bacterium]